MNKITDTDRINALIAAVKEDHELRLHDGALKRDGSIGLNVNCFGGDLRDAIDIALLRAERQAPSNGQI
jgi:hypothetical protein